MDIYEKRTMEARTKEICKAACELSLLKTALKEVKVQIKEATSPDQKRVLSRDLDALKARRNALRAQLS